MHGMYSRNGHNQPAAQAHTYSYTAIWSSSTYLRVKQFPIFHVLLCHIAVVGKVKSPNQSVIKGRVQEVVTIRWPPYGVVFEQNLLWKQKIFSASKKVVRTIWRRCWKPWRCWKWRSKGRRWRRGLQWLEQWCFHILPFSDSCWTERYDIWITITCTSPELELCVPGLSCLYRYWDDKLYISSNTTNIFTVHTTFSLNLRHHCLPQNHRQYQ